MISTTESNFYGNKESGKVFSFISEYRGDEITPITLFNGLKGARRFIFEGGSKEEHFGRYSFLGEKPYKEIQGETLKEIAEIKQEVSLEFDEKGNPFTFKGGAIGYMGYDSVGLYEKKLKFENEDDLNLPTIRFNFYKRYICYDHLTHKVYVVDNIFKDDNRNFEEIRKEQDEYFETVANNYFVITEKRKPKKDIELRFSISREDHKKNIEKVKEYIKSGDIFQVVLSRRMYCDTAKSPLEIYRRLREENPSPYMFLIDYEDYQVIGSSPESLVSVRDKVVTTNPIAGTRKRGVTSEEDSLLEKELIEDEKERAEHVMLVDLGRNDIGKVSKVGTVEVKDFMNIERFSHVMHITTKVVGELEEGKDCFDALASCLPAGTLSGAPKIRAMEIIEELENKERGIYAGSVGYFSYGGDMDMCIAIRTLVLKDGVAYLQAGGGLVYDSDPENECLEIENKLMALKEALR
ncbi:anthranilate synthase component I [Clostridium sp. SHJSY1]|uniref:anthranilate synthase component I n=1 Tax=Clostridium sp. SHJSY1 TaxID=2942483 RepID=UPI002875CAD2|nr:anthranilate synthase component I [Clostridium sp. SHJSY1]MDS0524480.1 anthranilate synthase component I [Clostridium sp. SHJSY1]